MKSSQYSKKVAELNSVIARKQSQKASLLRSNSNKHLSERTRSSNLKKIQTLDKEITSLQSEASACASKLEKARSSEAKEQEKKTKKIMAEYDKRINSLKKAERSGITRAMLQTKREIAESPADDAEESLYDVFVSHAHEDKEDAADELVLELQKLGMKVWYDSLQISWGSSLRESIDTGLAKSRFGIVILSPDYINPDKYWTKQELNGLFQRESIDGKVLLPIWHKMSKREIVNYSPILADRMALNTSMMTPAEIAAELKKLLEDSNKDE
ncbi:toll/interleukin-1 receptor domain-containing protein [Ileibacterium valens]|uniref:toll/interleukin-1 receptor domain-containing protein n=1 Tax=Ileibacterium valens TaxID=1862668 RepID=UPI0024BB8CD1|nr:toll/interleukin-1 receptor domain-containing protein [Ileibacterium valens]